MTEAELQHFAYRVVEMSIYGGMCGGAAFFIWMCFVDMAISALARWSDKHERIRNARWRAHWLQAMRQAREAGYSGRRAIAYAVDIMKTRRQAIRELEAL